MANSLIRLLTLRIFSRAVIARLRMRNCTRLLVVALIACSSGCASVPTQSIPAPVSSIPAPASPCLPGPFETDREKIAAAIASTRSVSTNPSRERRFSTKPDVWPFTDGVVSEGDGGLPPPYHEGDSVGISGRVEYDGTKYLARSVESEATLQGNHFVDEHYVVAKVRPTVEQARDIACLVNQLLRPPATPTQPERVPTQDPSRIPAEIVVVAPPRPCMIEYTDGHWESLVIRVAGAPAMVSNALSCGDATKLESLLSSAVAAPFLNAGVQQYPR
jgi:hypothetical protein